MKITKQLIEDSKKHRNTKLEIEGNGQKYLVIRNTITNTLHPFPCEQSYKRISIPSSQLVSVYEWINS